MKLLLALLVTVPAHALEMPRLKAETPEARIVRIEKMLETLMQDREATIAYNRCHDACAKIPFVKGEDWDKSKRNTCHETCKMPEAYVGS